MSLYIMSEEKLSVQSTQKGITIDESCVFKSTRRIGRGGFAEVFEGVWNDTTPCALKCFTEGDDSLLERIYEECSVWQSLRHPNIAQLLGICPTTGQRLPYLIIELMETSLHQYLRAKTDLKNTVELETKVTVLLQVAAGLVYLHNRGLMHGDLTACNVLLEQGTFKAKITDFGMARIIGNYQEYRPSTYGRGSHMPPEMQYEPPSCSEKVDVFSFGILIIHTLIQKYPHPIPATKPGSRQGEMVPLTEYQRYERLLKDLTENECFLQDIVRRCLENNAEDRPTALEVFKTLQRNNNSCSAVVPLSGGPLSAPVQVHYHMNAPVHQHHVVGSTITNSAMQLGSHSGNRDQPKFLDQPSDGRKPEKMRHLSSNNTSNASSTPSSATQEDKENDDSGSEIEFSATDAADVGQVGRSIVDSTSTLQSGVDSGNARAQDLVFSIGSKVIWENILRGGINTLPSDIIAKSDKIYLKFTQSNHIFWLNEATCDIVPLEPRPPVDGCQIVIANDQLQVIDNSFNVYVFVQGKDENVWESQTASDKPIGPCNFAVTGGRDHIVTAHTSEDTTILSILNLTSYSWKQVKTSKITGPVKSMVFQDNDLVFLCEHGIGYVIKAFPQEAAKNGAEVKCVNLPSVRCSNEEMLDSLQLFVFNGCLVSCDLIVFLEHKEKYDSYFDEVAKETAGTATAYCEVYVLDPEKHVWECIVRHYITATEIRFAASDSFLYIFSVNKLIGKPMLQISRSELKRVR